MSKPTLDAALGIVDRLLRSAEGFAGTIISVAELEKIREAIVGEIIKPEPAYTGPMDPACYYAKSCGFEIGTCPVCKDRRQVPADGIYYSDELGQPDAEREE